MAESITRRRLNNFTKWSRNNILLILTILGVLVGIILGLVLRQRDLNDRKLTLVSFPGDLFLRALYLIIGPLVLVSVIGGISNVKSRNMGSAGLRIVIYYVITTMISSISGVSLGVLFRPGGDGSESIVQNSTTIGVGDQVDASDVVLDIFRNFIPDNIVRAMFQSQSTKYRSAESSDRTQDNETAKLNSEIHERYIDYTNNVNFLGIIIFGIVFGTALRQIGEKGKLLNECVTSVSEVLTRMVTYVMRCTPIGVLFLIAGNIAGVDNTEGTITKLAKLCGITLLGLFIHFVLLTLVFYVYTRKNPFRFMDDIVDAMTVAWATASSCATLPTTIRCLEKNCGVSSGICQLVLPIGATINMDSGGIHHSIVALYVAQLHSINYGFGMVFKIMCYSALSSVGAAAIPNGFFAAILFVLRSSDLPTQDVGMFFTVEWLLDRFKTCLNVYGDCIGAAMVHHWQTKLKSEDTVTKSEDENSNFVESINEAAECPV